MAQEDPLIRVDRWRRGLDALRHPHHGYPGGVSRASAVLAALTAVPTSTSDLYDRVGYRTLVREGLVQYETFRAELVGLSAAGLAEGEASSGGTTVWRLREPPKGQNR